MDGGATIGDFAQSPGSAAEAAGFLSLLANEKRLLVLCHLQANGECDATSLAQAAGLSASALSHHLSRLRAEGFVNFRRDGQTLFYYIDDPRVLQVMGVVKNLFCEPAR